MKPEKEQLRRRELELQRLIRQMKLDELQSSKLYRNLEDELEQIKQELALNESVPEKLS